MYSIYGLLILVALIVPVIIVVLLVVALVRISVLKREVGELRQRQNRLEALSSQPLSSQPSPQQPAAAFVPQPAQFTQAAQVVQPASSPQPSFQPSVQLPPQPGMSPQTIAFSPPSPQQPVPQQLGSSQQPVPPFGAQQQPISFQPVPQRPASQTSLETLFGRNVIGIVASILVFFGLLFLGFLVVPLLTDALKIAALFLLSTLVAALGFILNRKYGNNFTKALLGTGCGAFFISIMLTHLHFHAVGDLVALGLLLAWLILCFILTKVTQSLLVAIITHVGMVISVSAACLVGVGDGRMMLVLVYQVAATAVILVGNILCYRKTYRFGLYASLAVSVLASMIFWAHLPPQGIMPTIPDAIYFLTQFIGATALAYLLFVSTTRVKRGDVQVILQTLTMLLWLGALTLDVGLFILWVMGMGTNLSIAQTSMLVSLVLFALTSIFALLTILLRHTLSFSRGMERATICLVAGYSCLLCFWRLFAYMASTLHPDVFFGLLYLVVPAAALILMQRLTNDELYGYLAAIPLGVDALFMVGVGYGELERLAPVGPSLGYLVLMGVLLWLAYRGLPTERRSRHGALFGFIMLLFFEFSLCGVAFHTRYDFALPLALLLCAVALGVFHFAGRDKPLWAYRINEYGVVLLAFTITFRPEDDPLLFAVHIALVLACLVLMLERVRQVAIRSAADLREGRPLAKNDIETLTALALFLLIVGGVNSLADWSELPYVLSLACMVAALLVIALGFWSRARSLRLTGLVVLVICVLKLAVLDIGDVNSLMRVISFIIGGVICFAISALYNFLVKLQAKNG